MDIGGGGGGEGGEVVGGGRVLGMLGGEESDIVEEGAEFSEREGGGFAKDGEIGVHLARYRPVGLV